jgi:hypothetical protein
MSTALLTTSNIGQVIASIKSAITQTTHYTLTESSLDFVPVKDLLNLLKIETLDFDRVVSESDNSLTIAGQSALLGSSQVEVNLLLAEATGGENSIYCKVEVHTTLVQTIVDGLEINGFDLSFEYNGGDWIVSGDLRALVLDSAVTLAASYAQNAETKTLLLKAEVEMEAVDLGEVGNLKLSAIELEFTKPVPTEVGQVTELEWRISIDGAIVIPGAIVSDGRISIFKKEQEAGLVFTPRKATAKIPLPPDDHVSIELEFAGISLIRRGDAANREWTFDATVDLSFHDFDASVQPHLPNHLAMNFIANSQGVNLSVNGDLVSIEYQIPDVELSASDRLELGTAAIAITELNIKLGQVISLDAVLGIGLPSQLNTVFGRAKTEDGQIKRDAEGNPIAAMDFFRTFEIQNPDESLVKLKLSINQTGISIVPQTSFIKAIELQKDAEGNPIWHGDFGEYGAINVAVPIFSYATDSFIAKGGFEVERPLALPLTPIKQLLEAAKLQGAADTIPEKLSLKPEINATNFVDKVTEKLGELVAQFGNASVTEEVKQILQTIARSFHNLPTAFTDYLNVEISQSFKFDIGVTPDGSIRFDASVKEGDPPIKLMFPGFMLALPVLNGITLRSISFGLTAGGNLFLIKVDADVDQFDLASMAIAVGLAELPNNPLPHSKAIHRRLNLNHLVMVAPVEFPIPIPIFYDNIGIEYLGLEDLLLNAHAQFPMPSPSFKTVGQVLSNLKGFFTDRDFKLSETPPDGFSPELFSLKQNFLQLPSYMGGQTLGDPIGGPTLTYAEVAHLLNGLKTLSVNELIQSVPLTQRIGNTNVNFGPISGALSWLVSTPDEFQNLATQQKALTYRQLDLTSDAQANAMFSVLPTQANPKEQGMVIFLKGKTAIDNVASFETVFGLVASASQGFTTGFQMRGEISAVLSMEMGGLVKINGKNNPGVSLSGRTRLQLASQKNPVFQGDIQITNQRFQGSGSLDIYGLGGNVNLTIDRTKGIFMKGSLNPIDLTVFKLKQATVDVDIRSQRMPTLGIHSVVELLGLSNQTKISLSEQGFQFMTQGKLFNAFNANLTASGVSLKSTANFRIAAQMQNDLTDSLKRETTQLLKSATDKASADLSKAQQEVTNAQQEVNRLNNEINRQRSIVSSERSTANQKLQSAITDLNAKQREVDRINGAITARQRRIAQLTPAPICKTVLGQRICVPGVPSPSATKEIARLSLEISGLGTEMVAAKAGLQVAQKAVELAQKAVVNIPVDADPRVAGPLGLLVTAQKTLQLANSALEGLKTVSRSTIQASNFILQRGLDALLLVRSASFETDINTASNAQVMMSVQLSYMDSPIAFQGGFNLRDLNSVKPMAQAIVRQLLP